MNEEAKQKVIERMAELDPGLAAKFVQKPEEKPSSGDFITSFLSAIKGDKGDKPEYKKDYLTEDEIAEIKKEITPKKGEHYFTIQEIQDFLDTVTPRKGEHYFDGENGQNGKDGYTPVKGVDYFDGLPGEKGEKGDKGDKGDSVSAEDVLKAVRELKGNDRLDITNLRNGEQLAAAIGKLQKLDMSDMRWHGGGIVTIQDAGTQVTNKATVLNFTGSGINSITELNGVVTIDISGGGSGITSINADTTAAQVLAVGTSGTDFAIADNGTGTHTFNLPTASATNRGALSSADWTTFNSKFNLPSLTAGSVLFSNGTTIAQDNANLFWDDTNNRLGIGTTSPSSLLHVSKATSGTVATFSNVANAINTTILIGTSATQIGNGSGGLQIDASASGYLIVGPSRTTVGSSDGLIGNATMGGLMLKSESGGVAGKSVILQGYNGTTWQNVVTLPNVSSGNVNLLLANNGGNVGIGTTAPGARLQVDGAASSIAAILKANATTPGNILEAQNSSGSVLASISSNGRGTFDNVVAANGVRVDGSGNGFYFDSRGFMLAPSSGVFKFTDATDADFGRLQLGGTTSSYPAIKRSTTTILAVLADDSGPAVLRSSVLVTAQASTPKVVAATDTQTVYTNEGASAIIVFTLPTAAAGLTYTFYVQDADGIRVTANTGDVININGVASSTAGYCQSTSVGSSVTLTAINATDWVATSVVGTWTLA